MTSSYQKISGFDRPHVSEMLSDSKISTLESGFKNFRICLRIRRMRVDNSRIPKEKVADSKISGYVWTGPHNPGRDPSWDPSKKRRDPTWDEHGIPGGIGGIPHLILTWVIVNGFQPTKLLSFRIACDRRPAKGSCFPFRGSTNSIRFFFIQTSGKLVRTLYHPLKRLSLNTAWMHFCT